MRKTNSAEIVEDEKMVVLPHIMPAYIILGHIQANYYTYTVCTQELHPILLRLKTAADFPKLTLIKSSLERYITET